MICFCSRIAGLLAAAFIFSASAARAGDEGLYPDAPPPGSAFVRFVNTGASASIPITVASKSYGAAPRGSVTRYIPTPHGSTQLDFGSASSEESLAEGKHYCAMLAEGKLTLLEEPVGSNPLKAQIILINASGMKDVSLKTNDGVRSVVDAIGPRALGARAVNAVKVSFAVYAGDKKINDLEARNLERGGTYAIVVYEDAGKPVVSFN